MKKSYESLSPVYLLILSWGLILSALVIRSRQGLDLPLINMLFIVIGIGAYYLPTRYAGKESGDILRRKLLGFLVLAGLLIFLSELIRLLFPGLIPW
ncbi:hypothetical protein KAU08_09305 [bacterium]|jgi:hypothetical protein|nr:hypothetical protein [bacterium]